MIDESKLASFVSRITCTVKTHKPVGELAARCIHASPKMGLGGLSAILHKLLSEKSAGISHVCIDSAQVFSKITGNKFGERVAFVKSMFVISSWTETTTHCPK